MSTSLTRVAVNEVARAARVSKASVVQALERAGSVDSDTWSRIDAAIRTLGLRSLLVLPDPRPRRRTFGVLMYGVPNPFFYAVLAGARAPLREGDHDLIIAPSITGDLSGRRALDTLLDRDVDGILAISPLTDASLLESIAARVPFVMLGRHDEADNYDTVMTDDLAGAELVMQHLFAKGHTSIAHLTHEDVMNERGTGTPHSLRLIAYEAAMDRAGLRDRARLLWSRAGGDSAYGAAREVLATPHRPTAIFAGHDQLALGALRAVHELGLTASDVAVVGYDNSAIAAHPLISLTSVDQAGEQLGRRGIELLIERVAGRRESERFMTTPRLFERASSRMPRPAAAGH